MKTPRKWSIGTLLLWTLVFGLVTSHVVNNWPQNNEPLYDVLFKHGHLEEIVQALDPSARCWSSGGSPGVGKNFVRYEDTGVFETSSADAAAMLSYIQTSTLNKFKAAGWQVRRRGGT